MKLQQWADRHPRGSNEPGSLASRRAASMELPSRRPPRPGRTPRSSPTRCPTAGIGTAAAPGLGSMGSSEGGCRGFTIIELLIAMVVLTFGLLSAGQLIYVAMYSSSLARSKGNAAWVAQSKIEELAALYSRNPRSPALDLGTHGPDEISIMDPVNKRELNRFKVTWSVTEPSGPNPGRNLQAKQITVTVSPTTPAIPAHSVALQNKVVHVRCIFGRGVS